MMIPTLVRLALAQHLRQGKGLPPMIVNACPVSLAFKGFKTVFTDAYLETPVNADKIVMTVPSASRDETYGGLGQFPSMREWVGPRPG